MQLSPVYNEAFNLTTRNKIKMSAAIMAIDTGQARIQDFEMGGEFL